MQYTTQDYILEFCPIYMQNLIDENPNDFSPEWWAETLLVVSETVDSYVGDGMPLGFQNNTQRFPNVDDDPATPIIVRDAASKFGHYRVNLKLKEINRQGKTEPSGIISNNSAIKTCEKIRDGVLHVVIAGVDITKNAMPKLDYRFGPTPFTQRNFKKFKF